MLAKVDFGQLESTAIQFLGAIKYSAARLFMLKVNELFQGVGAHGTAQSAKSSVD
jgi:hypothetical protein